MMPGMKQDQGLAERAAKVRALVVPEISAGCLSLLCGRARSYWQKMESGECDDPTGDTLRGILGATGVDPTWLLTGTGAAPTAESVSERVAMAKKAGGR